MRYGSIYVATNKHTGHQYVGQTRQLVQKRWDAHWRTAVCSSARKAKFQHALVTYGKEAFQVEEVFSAFDARALNEMEVLFISNLNPGYNSTRGGKGLRPITVSEETKRKRSDAAKARWANAEWREKTVESIKAAGQTDEAKARGKVLAALGSMARWANHNKKEPKQCRVKLPKQKCDPSIGKARMIRSKWKPVYCPELQCSFLSQKAAAEYLGVVRTSITNAVKQEGKVKRMFTLMKVA